MILFRLLNPQGLAGLAAALVLAVLLVAAKIDARHWHKQSAHYEQLYRGGEAALAGTIANVRAAAAQAQAADRASVDRVETSQRTINERSADALDSRLADIRARAHRLRLQTASAAAAPGGGPAAVVSGLPGRSAGTAQAAGEGGFPAADQLIATEQAIQLDELIKWVRAQGAVERRRNPSPGDGAPRR